MDEEHAGYGMDAIDTQPPDIPLAEEEYRWRVYISRPAFAEYAMEQIWKMRISIALKRSCTHLVKTFISESAMFAHNESVADAMANFDLAMYSMKQSFAPHDATCPELYALLADTRSEYQHIASRTVGGEKSRERTLQHRTVHEQHVSQVLEQKQPEKKKGIFGI